MKNKIKVELELVGFKGYRHFENVKYLIERHGDNEKHFKITDSQAELFIVDAESQEGKNF